MSSQSPGIGSALPDMNANTSAQVLTNNGVVASWEDAARRGCHRRRGNSGKLLTTNGTAASWAAVTADSLLPSQSAKSGYFLSTNGTTVSWSLSLTALLADADWALRGDFSPRMVLGLSPGLRRAGFLLRPLVLLRARWTYALWRDSQSRPGRPDASRGVSAAELRHSAGSRRLVAFRWPLASALPRLADSLAGNQPGRLRYGVVRGQLRGLDDCWRQDC